MTLIDDDLGKKKQILLSHLVDNPAPHPNAYTDQSFLKAVGFESWQEFLKTLPKNIIDEIYEDIKALNSTINEYLESNETLTIPASSNKYSDGNFLSTFNLVINGYAVSFFSAIGLILNIPAI